MNTAQSYKVNQDYRGQRNVLVPTRMYSRNTLLNVMGVKSKRFLGVDLDRNALTFYPEKSADKYKFKGEYELPFSLINFIGSDVSKADSHKYYLNVQSKEGLLQFKFAYFYDLKAVVDALKSANYMNQTLYTSNPDYERIHSIYQGTSNNPKFKRSHSISSDDEKDFKEVDKKQNHTELRREDPISQGIEKHDNHRVIFAEDRREKSRSASREGKDKLPHMEKIKEVVHSNKFDSKSRSNSRDEKERSHKVEHHNSKERSISNEKKDIKITAEHHNGKESRSKSRSNSREDKKEKPSIIKKAKYSMERRNSRSDERKINKEEIKRERADKHTSAINEFHEDILEKKGSRSKSRSLSKDHKDKDASSKDMINEAIKINRSNSRSISRDIKENELLAVKIRKEEARDVYHSRSSSVSSYNSSLSSSDVEEEREQAAKDDFKSQKIEAKEEFNEKKEDIKEKVDDKRRDKSRESAEVDQYYGREIAGVVRERKYELEDIKDEYKIKKDAIEETRYRSDLDTIVNNNTHKTQKERINNEYKKRISQAKLNYKDEKKADRYLAKRHYTHERHAAKHHRDSQLKNNDQVYRRIKDSIKVHKKLDRVASKEQMKHVKEEYKTKRKSISSELNDEAKYLMTEHKEIKQHIDLEKKRVDLHKKEVLADAKLDMKEEIRHAEELKQARV